MAFAHDLIEWDMDDITPSDNISDTDKKAQEIQSLTRLRQKLGDRYQLLLDKAQEYIDLQSPDSHQLHQIDISLP